jgi:hypothetical protein
MVQEEPTKKEKHKTEAKKKSKKKWR